MLNDILYFKNDILKEIKDLDIKINKQNNINNEINKKLITYNSKIEDLNKKIDNFTSIINQNSGVSNYYTEKIDKLFEFKTKIEQDTISQNCKLKLTAEELRDAINKYDRLISNNIIYPGIIGIDSKFKDYHEFIDFVLQQLQNLSLFKEKNIFDLKSYKKKLDSNLKTINIQMQSLLNNANTYAMKNIKNTEEKVLNEIKLYDAKLVELRTENSEFIIQMEKKNKELINEWSNVLNIKNSLTELVETTFESINNSNYKMQRLFDNYQEQINEIKNNYIFLLNSIQEIKDKKPEINKKPLLKNKPKEEIKMENKINLVNEKGKKNIGKINTHNTILKKEEKTEIPNKNKKVLKYIKFQRIKSAESILKNYIQGKSSLEDLIEKTNKKHLKENKVNNCPFSITSLVSIKNLDNSLINNNIDAFKTMDEGIKSKSHSSFLEKKKINKTLSNSPKTINISSSIIQINSKKFDTDNLKNNNFKNLKYKSKIYNYDNSNKILLKKDGENIINNNKNKSNEKEKNSNINRDIEKCTFFNKIAKIRQLDDISFLIDNNNDNNKNKFPKLEDNKAKQVDLSEQLGDNKKNRKRKSKIFNKKEDNNIMPSFKVKKIKETISSELIIQKYNNDKNENNSSLYNNKLNHINHSLSNECLVEYNQKFNDKMNKKGKSDFMKKGNSYNLKFEKNNY